MRQFILYAVAMADADQERLVPIQPSPTASSHVQSPQAPLQTQPSAETQHQASASASESAASSDSVSVASHMSPSQSASLPAVISDSSAPLTSASEPSATSSLACATSSASHSTSASAAEHQSAGTAVPSHVNSVVMTVAQGVRALRQYLNSVGRHGPSSGALLTPMYGCAELPQAFCR